MRIWHPPHLDQLADPAPRPHHRWHVEAREDFRPRHLAIEAGANTVQRASPPSTTVQIQADGRTVCSPPTLLRAAKERSRGARLHPPRPLGVDREGAHGLVDERWILTCNTG